MFFFFFVLFRMFNAIRIYDSNVPEGRHHVHRCLKGEECYRSVFQFTTAGCICALVVCVVLIMRRIDGLVQKLRSLVIPRRLAIE